MNSPRVFRCALLLLITLACACTRDHRNTPNGTPASPITVSATDLVSAYSDDMVRADAKYKNRILIVSGTISNIYKDDVVIPFITLESGDKMFHVQVYFTNSDTVKNLSKGQAVTVKGRCDGQLLDVQIKDAELH